MAYRIVAKSPDALEDIMADIKNWFQGSVDYVSKMDSESRKFVDPVTKKIVNKSIDIIHVKDGTTHKKTTIKFIPLLKPEEMKIEIGGDNEGPIKAKLKNQMKGRGVMKSYNKDTLRKMEAVDMLRNMIREEIKRIIQ